MNLKEIEEMVKLMNDNKLTELEVERNGLKIKLKKEDATIKRIIQESSIKPQEIIQEKASVAEKEAVEKENFIEIKAPMVGTFYRAPAPEAQPYVEVGQIINVGDVLCIIEAMKLMNEIKSEVKGKVVKMLGENGAPVEFGQTIFIVEPVE